MSDQFDEQDEFDEYGTAGAGSNAIRTLREKAKADAARIKELEDNLGKYVEKETRNGVADLLKNKGANPALAKFALQDGVKPSEEAVAAWLSENGSLFGFTPAQGDSGTQEPATPGQQAPTPTAPPAPQGLPNITPEAAQVLMQVLGAQAGAIPAQFQGTQAALEGAQTEAELMALIQANQ